jgi:hypothetical protein
VEGYRNQMFVMFSRRTSRHTIRPMRRLRIPCAIAFSVVTSVGAVSGGGALIGGCEHGQTPPGDSVLADGGDGGFCALFCIPENTGVDAGTDGGIADGGVIDGGVPDDGGVQCPPCADDAGMCPIGCRPVG